MEKAEAKASGKEPRIAMHFFRRLLVATVAAVVLLGIGRQNVLWPTAVRNPLTAAASANVVLDERPQEVFSTSVEMDEVFSEEDDSYVMPTTEASSSCKPVFA